MKLCSACLLGIPCRYNGGTKTDERVLEIAKKEVLIPICPEQLGGLPTPREPAEQKGNKVITKTRIDVTEEFQKGARIVLDIAHRYGIAEAILYHRSPSCGSRFIYDGTFSGVLKEGDGVTAALLKKHGITVVSEKDL